MKLGRLPTLPAAVLVVLATARGGCSTSSGDSTSHGSYAGRRSAACLEMQDRMCDLLADQCGAFSRADCDRSLQSTFCKSDSAADACTADLAGFACGNGYGLPDCATVYDPAPVLEGCREYLDVLCQNQRRCTDGPVECYSPLDCSTATGLSPSFDQCLADLRKLECSGETPPSCVGAVPFSVSVEGGA